MIVRRLFNFVPAHFYPNLTSFFDVLRPSCIRRCIRFTIGVGRASADSRPRLRSASRDCNHEAEHSILCRLVLGELEYVPRSALSMPFRSDQFSVIFPAYNASLSLTSVTSNTIISTTSSFFTLVFTHFCGVEKFTIKRLLAVMVVFGGIVLVSISDNDEGTQTLWGDALALTGAVFYGAYCSLLRVKIRDEKQVNMPMFFGFVGFFNMILLWPFLIILHYTGVEKFEVPSLQITAMLTVNGLIGTVVSDLIWSLSIFLTSALLGTLGLSLTVPLALTIDLVRGKKRLNVGYAFGGGLAIVGFLFANVEVPDRIEARIRSFFRLRLGCYKCCPPPDIVDDEPTENDKPLAEDGHQSQNGVPKDATVDVTTPLTAAH
jgi:drug/metabolite transporter (DMT)-like permease